MSENEPNGVDRETNDADTPAPRESPEEANKDRAMYRATRSQVVDNLVAQSIIGGVIGCAIGIVATGIVGAVNAEVVTNLWPYVFGSFVLLGATWGAIGK